MKCPRCHGMMVSEQIFTSQGRLRIARCVHCGDVIDSVVISNRKYMTGIPIKRVFQGCRFVASIAS